MAVGSIEIKQVQRTMNNGAVADAEQVQVKGRYTSSSSCRVGAPLPTLCNIVEYPESYFKHNSLD